MTNTKSLYYPYPIDRISAYALWRRLLITNPALSIKSAKEEFMSLFPAKRINTAIKKNCLTCAKNFYHSSVYDLPWVTVCPIHGTKLTEKCPICNHPWPKKNDLRKHSCHVCGAKHFFNEINFNDLYYQASKYSNLESIYDLLNIYNKTPNGHLQALRIDPWLSPILSTISINNPLMPTITKELMYGSNKILSQTGIATQSIYKFDLKNIKAYNKSLKSYYINKDNLVENRIIAKVRFKLVSLIKSSIKNEPYTDSLIEIDVNHLLADSNIYFIAFSIWQDLIKIRHSGYRRMSDLDFYDLYRDIANDIPLIPSVKRILSIQSNYMTICSDKLEHHRESNSSMIEYLALPDRIVSIIYELELWNLFFNVLSHINYLQNKIRNTSISRIDISDYFNNNDFLPCNSCNINIGIFKIRENFVSIIIPKQEFRHAMGFHDIEQYNSYDFMNLECVNRNDTLYIGSYYWRRNT